MLTSVSMTSGMTFGMTMTGVLGGVPLGVGVAEDGLGAGIKKVPPPGTGPGQAQQGRGDNRKVPRTRRLKRGGFLPHKS